jgi:membrane-associated HD superfamily phosphohydrolase
MPPKGQPITDPATLERYAEMRKKAQETLAKKREITEARRQERKKEFEKTYEEVVLKKKAPPPPQTVVEETEKDIYPTPPSIQSESEDEDEEPTPKLNKKSKSKSAPVGIPVEPNYKQLYYKAKLDSMTSQQQQNQQQQQFLNQYSQLTPQQHAIDIAQNALKSKANKAVYESVYRQLFNI